jgi:hypothetical protein
MRTALNAKRSKISMLEIETIPQSFIPQVQIYLSIVLYVRSLLTFCMLYLPKCGHMREQ